MAEESSEDDSTAGDEADVESDHTHDHHDEHDHGEERPAFDPENVELPSRAPPLRSTAPQSDFTMGQVTKGAVIAVIGLALVFGLPLALL